MSSSPPLRDHPPRWAPSPQALELQSLPVFGATASLMALWLAIMSLVVIRTRRAMGIAYGDGGNRLMGRRVRAHGNFTEYAPMFLLSLFLAEYQGVIRPIYLSLASIFFMGECRGPPPQRQRRPFPPVAWPAARAPPPPCLRALAAGRLIHGTTFMRKKLSVVGRLGGMFLTLVPFTALTAANVVINVWPVVVLDTRLFWRGMATVNKDVAFVVRESFNMRTHLTTFLKYLVDVVGGR